MCDKNRDCIAKAPCPVHAKHPSFTPGKEGPVTPYHELSDREREYLAWACKPLPEEIYGQRA
jgi:hypothetical protein